MTLTLSNPSPESEVSEAASGSLHFLGFALFFSIFVNLLMLTGPLFMLQVYDRVLTSRSEETLVALVILVIGLYGLMWLLEFSRSRLLARYGARFQSSLDARVFRAQMSAIGGAFPESASATRDLEAVQGFYASPAYLALFDMPFTPIFIAAIFIFHPWLGWLALSGGGILVGLAVLNQMLTAVRVAEAQRAAEAADRFSENARQASDLIRAQGMLDGVTARWNERRETALTQTMRAVDWAGSFSSFTKAFRLALQSMILALGAFLVLRGAMTAGAMIAASILLGRALAPVEQILGRWPQVVRARQGKASLKRFLARTPEPISQTRLPRPVGGVVVRGVSITTAPCRTPILCNVSFTVDPGQVLGVIGRSGSGKTTIARMLVGLVQPSLGEVRLGGALLSQYSPQDIGRYVGYLPQDAQLINGTIAENIARMDRAPDSVRVVEAASRANAHDLILSLPQGYNTRIEDPAIRLSGGQRQRIALARALYGNPVLLVLDEPNSALDMDGTEALNNAIRTMKSERRSVVIMTHRPLAISVCDRLMVLDAGTVKAIGSRDEILKSMMRNAGDIQRTLNRSVGT